MAKKKVFVSFDYDNDRMYKLAWADQDVIPLNAHAEGPLSEGDVEEGEVECLWHGSRFDLKTGEATSPPAGEAVTRYGVRIEGYDVLVGPA